MSVKIEERVKKEAEVYDHGIERGRYNRAFGHAQGGYCSDRQKNNVKSILENFNGKSILELGSQSWVSWIARNGIKPSDLTCINISQTELNKGIEAAKTLNYPISKHEFMLADAHNLNFPDKSFDVVIGGGILHHLDFEVAVKELHRVTKDGGKILFHEPLRRNPIGKIVRKLTPNARTPDEKPLDAEEFKILRKYFMLENFYYQLFYVPMGAISAMIFKSAQNPFTFVADKIDVWLEKMFKKTNFMLYFRHVLIYGTRINS